MERQELEWRLRLLAVGRGLAEVRARVMYSEATTPVFVTVQSDLHLILAIGVNRPRPHKVLVGFTIPHLFEKAYLLGC